MISLKKLAVTESVCILCNNTITTPQKLKQTLHKTLLARENSETFCIHRNITTKTRAGKECFKQSTNNQG